uniref:Uncharacterized protein n=1 Tax=Panagrellus redivivus TaxID=6233 RepID=A0A7E4VAH7_PANRE
MLDPGSAVAEPHRSRRNSASRPPTLGGRSPQSSFDSNGDVGQISLNFMRVNGSYAPFKTLLTSTTSRDNAEKPTQHNNHRPVGLNVACTGNGGPGSAIMTTTTANSAAATPPSNNLDRVNSNPIVLDQMIYNKRKESWQVNPNPCGTWRTSDIKLGDAANGTHTRRRFLQLTDVFRLLLSGKQ